MNDLNNEAQGRALLDRRQGVDKRWQQKPPIALALGVSEKQDAARVKVP